MDEQGAERAEEGAWGAETGLPTWRARRVGWLRWTAEVLHTYDDFSDWFFVRGCLTRWGARRVARDFARRVGS